MLGRGTRPILRLGSVDLWPAVGSGIAARGISWSDQPKSMGREGRKETTRRPRREPRTDSSL